MKYEITTQKQIRDEFWECHPEFKRRGRTKQNDYPADVRVAFVDFVERLGRDQEISYDLQMRATL